MPWSGLAAGLRTALSVGGAGELQDRVTDLLKARYGARDVLLTDSGTSALRLAIAAAVRGSGRPVGLPGYSCYDLATAAEGAGARVVLYDVEPSSLGPAMDSLEALRGLRPAAVVVAHLFGYAVDLSAVQRVAGDALIIEDAAQAAGGALEGRPLGSLGSVSVLSFGRGKGTTGGGGGALMANDDRGQAVLSRARDLFLERRLRRGLQQLGALAAQTLLGRPSLYWVPASLPFLYLGETRYHPPRPPRSASLASLAVLEHTIAGSDAEVSARIRNARRLLDAVRASSEFHPVEPVPGTEPGYLRLPVLASEGEHQRPLPTLALRAGIAAMYPTPLSALLSLRPRLVRETALPGALSLSRSLVALPTHSLMSEADLQAVEEWVGRGGPGTELNPASRESRKPKSEPFERQATGNVDSGDTME